MPSITYAKEPYRQEYRHKIYFEKIYFSNKFYVYILVYMARLRSLCWALFFILRLQANVRILKHLIPRCKHYEYKIKQQLSHVG
jgi:hypothetical protein